MERREAHNEKCAVSGVQEARTKVSKAREGVHLWCVWVREGAQVMREVGSGVGICNEREVI
jgi:hypothetical protein